jgi:hypothetical protein
MLCSVLANSVKHMFHAVATQPRELLQLQGRSVIALSVHALLCLDLCFTYGTVLRLITCY